MTFSYDLSTDIGRIRLAIGDTASATADLTDEEIQAALDLSESWQEAALRCVNLLIARYSRRAINVTVGPMRREMAAIIGNLKELKKQLSDEFGVSLLGTIESEDLTFSWNDTEDEEGEYSA
ncbi:MAG: hypothetical protein JXR84_04185 [Anaerolineae bacterium]|nr:hypothetical protein [Anaerolineae bacterium]